MGRILKFVWFSTKLGAAAGSVYLTADRGVWGSPEESNKLYNNIYEIIPGLKTFREEFVGDLIPKNFTTDFNFRDKWNSGVLATFSFIADSPAKAVDLKDYLVESVSSFIEQQSSNQQNQQKDS
ncbi:UNVERIFIED_CONTAM: hypothetical protein RMT77_015254 [Armadillidium vulgare]